MYVCGPSSSQVYIVHVCVWRRPWQLESDSDISIFHKTHSGVQKVELHHVESWCADVCWCTKLQHLCSIDRLLNQACFEARDMSNRSCMRRNACISRTATEMFLFRSQSSPQMSQLDSWFMMLPSCGGWEHLGGRQTLVTRGGEAEAINVQVLGSSNPLILEIDEMLSPLFRDY